MARADQVFRLRGESSYSQAVAAGGLLFISGTVSWDDDFKVVGAGDCAQQIAVVYRDIGRTLRAHDLTAAAIVKETVYAVDMPVLLAAQAVRGDFYRGTQPPASTWVAVERLARPALLIEVEAVAICGQSQGSAEGYSSNWTDEGRLMAKKNQVFNIRAAEKAFAYSQAVRAGNLLFISGTVSWDADATPVAVGDMRAQLQNVYEELKKTLEAHGASFADVAKETVYTRDMDALIAAAPARAAYFEDCAPPASTWVQVSRLVHSDLLLEVEMTAVLS